MFHNKNKFKLVALIQFKGHPNHWLCSSFPSINHKKPRLAKVCSCSLYVRQTGQDGGSGLGMQLSINKIHSFAGKIQGGAER